MKLLHALICLAAVAATLALLVLTPSPSRLSSKDRAGAGGIAESRTPEPRGLARFACDMHCEPGTSYQAPGICPICRMKLTPIDQLPYTAVVLPLGPASAQISQGSIFCRLLDPSGAPINHVRPLLGRPIATLALSADLRSFKWLEPISISQAASDLRVDLEPNDPARAMLIHDFVPLIATHDGPSSPNAESAPAQSVPMWLMPQSPEDKASAAKFVTDDWDVTRNIAVEGKPEYTLHVRCNGGRYVAGVPSLIRLGIEENLDPVTLRDEGGTRGRLIAISTDLKRLERGRPMINVDGKSRPSSGPDCVIHAAPKNLTGPSANPSVHTHTPATSAAASDVHDHTAHARTSAAGGVILENGLPTDAMFELTFPAPGVYRVFVLMHVGNTDLPGEFTIEAVAPGLPVSAAVPASPVP